MAAQKLTYTIVNAQLVTSEREVDFEGETATIRQTRTVIEAEPVEPGGKTFTAVLPADVIDQYPEGATLSLTLKLEA